MHIQQVEYIYNEAPNQNTDIHIDIFKITVRDRIFIERNRKKFIIPLGRDLFSRTLAL